jgi:hypothetical protein
LIVSSHKPLETREDLSLAYTPGVAAPVRAIANNPALVDHYTIKNFLNRTALPSITGFDAKGPTLPKPKTAEPSEMTATRLFLIV